MKRWIVFVTEHHFLFLLLVFGCFFLSFFLAKDLNVEAFPDPSPPIIEIVVLYEGRSAEEVERQITIPTEIALAGMVKLERINAISLYGLSDIKCKFSYDIQYKEAKQQVINRLSSLTLPDNIQPAIIPNPIGEVMRYSITGSDNLMELRTIQDWIVARHIKTAEGVEDVPSYGGYIKSYNVKVFPEKLVKYGIPLSQVLDSLTKSNTNVGGRAIEFGDQYYMVRGLGLIKSLSDIENSLVAVTKNGKPIQIKNIAEVTISNIPRTGIIGLNEKDEIVMGTVIIRKDAKSIPTIKLIHEKIKELNERILPNGIKVVPYYERWDLIMTVVKKVIETAATGITLVTIVLFIFLGNLRAAILTAIVIPISLLFSLSIMALKGESVNFLSIGAIDFGIIADIPLILVENYFRISKQLGSTTIAIEKASEEVGKPVFFSVIIILVAFTPLFMMKGAESQIFSPMAQTYLYTIIATTVLTFTYLVAAKHVFLKNASEREFGFIEVMREKYIKLIEILQKKSRIVFIITFIVFAGNIALGIKVLGTQFLPKMDEGNIYIRTIFPYSISLSKTYENAKKIRNILMSFQEVQTVDFKAGRPEDGTDPTGPFNTEYYVLLKPHSQWKRKITKEGLENIIREELKKSFPNADMNISQYIEDNLQEAMSGVKGENSVKIFGNDLHELDKVAKEVKENLESVSGIEDVGIFRELGQPNLLIEVNRENISVLGLTVQDVLDIVPVALGGKAVSEIIEGEKRFSLLVGFPPEYRNKPEKIASIPVILPSGGIVALSRLADIHYGTGASFIYRENFRRFVPVKFSVTAKDLGGTVAHAQEKMASIKLPEGYYMEWSGMFNEMKQAFKRFYVSIPLTGFLILLVLFLNYRSVKNVLIALVAPAFDIFGGVISLLITGHALSVSAMVGFISIIGVSVLNASILISHYIRLRQSRETRENAVIEAAKDRLRPVVMGGLVASFGLLPTALVTGVGSQIQKPLATVVVGGMLIDTLMILLILPLLLKYVHVEGEEPLAD